MFAQGCSGNWLLNLDPKLCCCPYAAISTSIIASVQGKAEPSTLMQLVRVYSLVL